MLKLKIAGSSTGFAVSTVVHVVLIACHIHICLERGSQGFTLDNTIKVYFVKSMGIIVMTQQFILGHMTLSYLLLWACRQLGEGFHVAWRPPPSQLSQYRIVRNFQERRLVNLWRKLVDCSVPPITCICGCGHRFSQRKFSLISSQNSLDTFNSTK